MSAPEALKLTTTLAIVLENTLTWSTAEMV